MNLSKLAKEFDVDVTYTEYDGFHTVELCWQNYSASAQAQDREQAEIQAVLLFVRTVVRNEF